MYTVFDNDPGNQGGRRPQPSLRSASPVSFTVRALEAMYVRRVATALMPTPPTVGEEMRIVKLQSFSELLGFSRTGTVIAALIAVVVGSGIAGATRLQQPQGSLWRVGTLGGRVSSIAHIDQTLFVGAGGELFVYDYPTMNLRTHRTVDGTPVEWMSAYRGFILAQTQHGLYRLRLTAGKRLEAVFLTSNIRLTGSAIVGDYALQPSLRVNVIQLSDVGPPRLKGTYRQYGSPRVIKVAGTTAYLGLPNGRVTVLDVADPESPRFISALTPTLGLNAFEIAGTQAYAYSQRFNYDRSGGGLVVCDLSNSLAPRTVGHLVLPPLQGSLGSGPLIDRLVSHDGLVFILNSRAGMAIVDARNPESPSLIQGFDGKNRSTEALIVGKQLVIARSDSGLDVLDIASPSGIFSGGRIKFPNAGKTTKVTVDQGTAFIVNYSPDSLDYWLRSVSISDSSNPIVLDELPIGVESPEKVAFYQDRLFIPTGPTITVVDKSDANHLTVVDQVRLSVAPTKIAVVPPFLLASTTQNVLQVFDLSNPDGVRHSYTNTSPQGFRSWGVVGKMVYSIDPPSGPERADEERSSNVRLYELKADGRLVVVVVVPIRLRNVSDYVSSASHGSYIYFGNDSLHVLDTSNQTDMRPSTIEAITFGFGGGAIISAQDRYLIRRLGTDNGCRLGVYSLVRPELPVLIATQTSSTDNCGIDATGTSQYLLIASSWEGLTISLPLPAGDATPPPPSDPLARTETAFLPWINAHP